MAAFNPRITSRIVRETINERRSGGSIKKNSFKDEYKKREVFGFGDLERGSHGF